MKRTFWVYQAEFLQMISVFCEKNVKNVKNRKKWRGANR